MKANPASVIAFLLLAPTACGEDEPYAEPDNVEHGFDEQARSELAAVGLDRYFGEFTPDSSQDWGDHTVVYTFDPRDDGPTCIEGDSFTVSIRDLGSPDLLVYLQGGGACWGGKNACSKTSGAGIQPIGWTDNDQENNPTLSQFNVVFVGYCDGSVFSGDNLVKASNGAIERRHRGVANLSAALDLSRAMFPTPRRVVLAGSSAGGYGTILGTALTRLAYPTTPMFVINDAGLGLTNPEDPSIVDAAINEWGFGQFVPASCKGCLESGQFSSVIDWGLRHDPGLKVGVFSAYEDGIIGGAFLGMKGSDYRQLMLTETDKLAAAYPHRFKRFFIEGASHTAILAGYYDVEVGGTTLLQWTDAMLNNRSAWRDLLE